MRTRRCDPNCIHWSPLGYCNTTGQDIDDTNGFLCDIYEYWDDNPEDDQEPKDEKNDINRPF